MSKLQVADMRGEGSYYIYIEMKNDFCVSYSYCHSYHSSLS